MIQNLNEWKSKFEGKGQGVVGIDIATGVTLKGVHHGHVIRYVPGTKRKLNGIKIPKWKSLLEAAVMAADAAKLNYGGVDILLHKDKGPMIVELNGSPGLDIQIANRSGLRKRLERVEGLKIRDIEHGVRVGRALFAEWFADKVKADEGLTVVDSYETVVVRGKDKKVREEVDVIIDTGAFRSAIDKSLAEKLGLLVGDNVLWQQSNLGNKIKREVIEVTFYLKGRRIKSAMRVSNRSKVKRKILIGRRDLQGFLVNPQLRGK